MNKAKLARCIELYENIQLDPELIGEELDCSVDEVRATLAKNSIVFQSNIESGDEYISEDELKGFYAALKGLALGSEDDKIRKESLIYLINDARGRNDLKKNNGEGGSGNGNTYILAINNHIKKAKEALAVDEKELIEIT